MRLILLLCSLICYGMANPAQAGPLADRLAGELAKQAPEQALPLDEVQRLDRRLIAPDPLHPAWQRYPLRQLQAIYRYQQECGTENELPAEWLPLLRALCGQGAVPSARWFAAHPIYPLGGSSAARWLAGHPAAGLDALLHVRERRDQLGLLGELGDDNLDALLRDAPLLRDYRVQLTGEGPITAAELVDPAGHNRLAGAQWEAEGSKGVRVVGADLPMPLPAGLYQLRLTVAGKEWQVALPLPAVQDLDWLSRSPQAVANPPANPASCTPLWLDQAVLARPQYSLLWWHRIAPDEPVNWPTATPDSWRTLSLVQTSQRGQLVLQLSHSQAGPVD
ncbi:DUF2861 family protein [Aeromonas veronii]